MLIRFTRAIRLLRFVQELLTNETESGKYHPRHSCTAHRDTGYIAIDQSAILFPRPKPRLPGNAFYADGQPLQHFRSARSGRYIERHIALFNLVVAGPVP